ncbi:THAP-type domain-containing protein, partial [Aphis craccivora]
MLDIRMREETRRIFRCWWLIDIRLGFGNHFYLSYHNNPGISLHRFPKDPCVRTQWLNACGFTENDILCRRQICSMHFEQSCCTTGHKKVLKRGSIPTKCIEKLNLILLFYGSIQTINDMSIQSESCENQSVIVTPESKYCSLNMDLYQNQIMCMSSTSASIQTEPLIYETPKHERKRKCFVGDIKTPDLLTPRKSKCHFKKAKLQILNLNQTVRRLRNKLSSLGALFKHLKNNNLITENAHDEILVLSNKLADPIKETINRNLKSRNTKYSPALRSFALTLQFYSSKAYLFVRKTFKNLLPHPNTLKKWYSVIDGEPGFTKEAFQSITKRVSESADPVICNIVIDEMSIRKQITYLNGKFYGGVDLGTTQEQVDNIHEATNALVFLAVCINGHWKVPLGYFLINSFSGSERANLLKKCLEIFFETGAKCYSITFDGAPCNISMCKILGANFDYFSSEFKPWISVPEFPGSKNEKIIYIFWDAVHMIKLVRNTLGEKKVIINPVGEQIKWHHIEMLQSIQETKGLHAANKLKKNHINYFENKMSVRLAVQTLSSSVSSSLLFCERLNLIPNAKPTADFCKIFNDVFDVCNCRNKLAKGDYSFPVNEKNLQRIIDLLDQFKSYVEGLKYQKNLDTDEELLLKSQRKT